jgi:RNA polymerase sigma-70 factor (ECF subfamily)
VQREEAFKQLFYQHHKALVAYAVYLISDKPVARELVNDVFINVWKNQHHLDLQDNLKPYLYRAVKNRSINHLKKRKVIKTDLEELDQPADTQSDHLIIVKQNEDMLQQWINELPDRCKQVFLMSRVDGLPNKEIADLLDISIKTVENQMTKALKHFRKKLKKE